MTDITELARERLKEKFDAWFEREYKHLESSKYTDAVPHIKYGFWTAYQAGGAELIEALEKAQQRNAKLESSGTAPGILRCTECTFVQTKNIISVTADTITTVESEPEPCPNGCGQLQPVTWKALAIQLMFTTKQGLSDLLEAKKRIEELESDLSEWTDCKHDGATYYDMSGQERCGRCGADV